MGGGRVQSAIGGEDGEQGGGGEIGLQACGAGGGGVQSAIRGEDGGQGGGGEIGL